MASPTTTIEIISNASILLNNGEIVDLSTAGAAGVALQSGYDLLLDAAVETERWRFAAATTELSVIAGVDPDFDNWNYAYQLPADYLSMQRVSPNINYEIFGDRLYSGGNGSLSCEYYSSSPAVTLWSSGFKAYFTYLLAQHAGISVTENPKILAAIDAGVNKWFAKAAFASSTSRPARPMASQPYVTVRN